jgi:hypothetical protein
LWQIGHRLEGGHPVAIDPPENLAGPETFQSTLLEHGLESVKLELDQIKGRRNKERYVFRFQGFARAPDPTKKRFVVDLALSALARKLTAML